MRISSSLNRTVSRSGAALLLAAGALAFFVPSVSSRASGANPAPEEHVVQSPEPPLLGPARGPRGGGPVDVDASNLMRATLARAQYSVSGAGLAAAILDTGLRVTHRDFEGRIAVVHNFTTDDDGAPDVVEDGNGHGTNVAGIVGAGSAFHTGIAPGANLVPLKVLPASGNGSFAATQAALDWVIENHDTYHITVVNLSLGDGQNYSRVPFKLDPVIQRIRTLRTLRIPTCAAAGNKFAKFKSRPGMAYPAITPQAISVGAVYDSAFGASSLDGAVAHSTGPDRIAAFSQRLFTNSLSLPGTDVFAPGAIIESAGNGSDSDSSFYAGTSQATPMVTGAILLLQQYALRTTGSLPPVTHLVNWLREGGVAVRDGDDEKDNVKNTGKTYRRVNLMGAFRKMIAAHAR